MVRPIVLVLIALLFGGMPASLAAQEQPFAAWLVDLRTEAQSKGISSATLDAALTDLEPIPRVIELDRRQPEFTWTFRKYMGKLVNQTRIDKGKQKLSQNSKLLNWNRLIRKRFN